MFATRGGVHWVYMSSNKISALLHEADAVILAPALILFVLPLVIAAVHILFVALAASCLILKRYVRSTCARDLLKGHPYA